MAPKTMTPSLPRLIRPARSVRHSPSETKRKGVLTRSAPPSMATRTVPIASISAIRPPRLEPGEAAEQRVARQDRHEDEDLQHQHCRVRHVHAPLQQATRGAEAA